MTKMDSQRAPFSSSSGSSGIDQEMKHVIDQLTDDGLHKQIDRAHGVVRTVEAQLDIYNQAQLIFLGKLVVYFKAMGTSLPNSIREYIA